VHTDCKKSEGTLVTMQFPHSLQAFYNYVALQFTRTSLDIFHINYIAISIIVHLNKCYRTLHI